MASIKFFTRSKTATSQIYIRFIVGYRKEFQTKTGLTINVNEWSKEKSLPKQNNPTNKLLVTKLKNLETFILTNYNDDLTNGVIFSLDWLKYQIDKHFGRAEEQINTEVLTNYLLNYIEYRKLDNRTKTDTDRKYYNLLTKLQRFEKYKKRQYLISEIDRTVLLEFRKWLIEKDNLMESTANARLKNLKTVLRDAWDNGLEINRQINNFSIESIQAIKVFLTFSEIEKIKKTPVLGDELIHAKDWLVIGCYTGQRVGDLLRMNTGQIFIKTDSEGNSHRMIEFTQEKTGQNVTIPIHDEVETILLKYDGCFPPKFGTTQDSSHALFNRYIKRVCEVAGINNIVKGKIFNEELKKNEIKETEKFNLVSSHICRRSFATNFYGDKRFTTPQIMAITGHQSEKVFLTYIGKTSSDHALNTAKAFKEIKDQQQKIS